MKSVKPLTAIIVDDELHCIKTLKWELKSHCPFVEVIATFTDSIEALHALPQLKHDILFMDIEMPQLNGFDLLHKLPKLDSHLIFTTAYSEYAVKAFKYSAVDYILKPVDSDDLKQAIKKITDDNTEIGKAHSEGALKVLLDNLDSSRHGRSMRISLPLGEGYELVEIAEILRCKSDGSYTEVYLDNGRMVTISRNLKQVEQSLPTELFVRVHHSHLVNINHVRRYLRQDGGTLIMSDGSEVAVARSRKDLVLNLMR